MAHPWKKFNNYNSYSWVQRKTLTFLPQPLKENMEIFPQKKFSTAKNIIRLVRAFVTCTKHCKIVNKFRNAFSLLSTPTVLNHQHGFLAHHFLPGESLACLVSMTMVHATRAPCYQRARGVSDSPQPQVIEVGQSVSDSLKICFSPPHSHLASVELHLVWMKKKTTKT
jgi:hypothetical protein